MPAASNSSASGGYLLPTTTAPASDLDLDHQIQALLVGLTGLPGELVRIRFPDAEGKADKPLARVPDRGTTWVVAGVTATSVDASPALIHDGAGEGSTMLRRQERIDVLASFYGPRGDAYAALVRDSLYVPQNREGLHAQGMTLTDVGEARRVPEIVALGTRRRTDLPIRLARVVERTLPIRNLVQAHGTVIVRTGAAEPFETPDPL